jgi:hypothetical protein
MALGFGIGIPFIRRRGEALDPSAAAFIAAAGITDSMQKEAINRLVLNYKGIGNLNTGIDLWSVSLAIYPLVGSSASAHKFNLKNPLDTNAARRLTFSGGITHDSNGITGNGLNGFANTFVPPNALGQNSHRILSYVRTDSGSTAFQAIISATNAAFSNGLGFETRQSTNSHQAYSNSGFSPYLNVNRTGFLGLIRTGLANYKTFRNGALINTFIAASVAPIANNLYILSQNNNGNSINYGSQNLAFALVGDGLSDANALLEYQIIQQFQTDLGRQI